mmetsp:Transcript_14857/g.42101  ORF Transcript_14857/g.42101 Transcript_14857/m.42101 type:complete len:206 (-) Transcript_14857:96-713(-)
MSRQRQVPCQEPGHRPTGERSRQPQTPTPLGKRCKPSPRRTPTKPNDSRRQKWRRRRVVAEHGASPLAAAAVEHEGDDRTFRTALGTFRRQRVRHPCVRRMCSQRACLSAWRCCQACLCNWKQRQRRSSPMHGGYGCLPNAGRIAFVRLGRVCRGGRRLPPTAPLAVLDPAANLGLRPPGVCAVSSDSAAVWFRPQGRVASHLSS